MATLSKNRIHIHQWTEAANYRFGEKIDDFFQCTDEDDTSPRAAVDGLDAFEEALREHVSELIEVLTFIGAARNEAGLALKQAKEAEKKKGKRK